MGAYHLAKLSGWNDRCVKVSDFRNLLTKRMKMAPTIYHPGFRPAYLFDLVRKGLKTERFSQMVKVFREFHSQQKKRIISGSCPQFPKRFSETLASISPQTEISGFFRQMVTTQSTPFKQVYSCSEKWKQCSR